MNIDEIFGHIGGLGRQQWKYTVYLSLIHLYFPSQMLSYPFVARKLGLFHCTTGGNETKIGECPGNEVENCASLAFPESGETSLVSEFELVCDREWYRPTTMSAFMAGVMVGAVSLGTAADAFGRKFTLFLTLFFMVLTSLWAAFSSSFVEYCISRALNGFFCGGHTLALAVLCNELVGSEYRGSTGAVMSTSWSLGIVFLSFVAYEFRNWRSLQLFISLSGLPILLSYFFIPESPRWLYRKGKVDRANAVIKQIAEGNGKEYSSRYVLTLESEQESSSNDPAIATKTPTSVLELFTYRGSVTLMTVLLMYTWFVHGASYYGLTIAASSDGGGKGTDLYMSTAIRRSTNIVAWKKGKIIPTHSGAVEIPASFLACFLITYIGRKRPLCGFMACCGLSLLMIALISSALPFMVVSVAMFGKLCISASFTIIHIHTTEVFPTAIRNTGMGLVAITSRIGGILSPYLANLGHVLPNLHFVLFGLFSLTSGLLNLKLPETLGAPLPETMEDVVRLKKRGSSSSSTSRADGTAYTALSNEEEEVNLGSESESDI